MNKRLFYTIGLPLALIGVYLGQTLRSAFSQRPTSSQQDVGSEQISGNLRDEDWYYRGWTSEPMSGDNKPYKAIRQELRALGADTVRDSWLATYRRRALETPNDSRTQFRRVYAELWLHKNHADYLVNWRQALSRPVSPRAYDYTRLRFLISAELAMTSGKYAYDARLKRVGQQLMNVEPDDKPVAYWLRQIKANTSSLQDKLDNLKWAQSQVKANPKDFNAQARLGGAYSGLWMLTRRRSHANLAVAYYTKYLAMAPQSDPFRHDAQFWANAIPKDQARWEKQGIGRRN